MKPQLTEFQQGVLALAKSMEQGMRKTAPARGTYFDLCQSVKTGKPVKRNGKTYKACALGAAYVNGYKLTDVPLGLQWYNVRVQHPVIQTDAKDANGAVEMLGSHVIDMNDYQKISRPRIVAWLRRLAKRPVPPFSWSEVA